MEPTIVAALVAASVSALGLLVQLRITRVSSKDNREQSALQSLSELQKQAYMNLVRLERETERLRICSWEMEGTLMEFLSQYDKKNCPSINELRRLLDDFAKQSHNFANLWADIRPDIPSRIEGYVRHIRHECLNGAKSITSGSNTLGRISTAKTMNQESLNLVQEILEKARVHRNQLDELAKTIKSIRESIIGSRNQF